MIENKMNEAATFISLLTFLKEACLLPSEMKLETHLSPLKE
jgi:hypothetical protein